MFCCHNILQHPAANLLLQYAVEGCPVDCKDNWTLEQLEKAIKRGAHPSARTPRAAKACRDEALVRVTSSWIVSMHLRPFDTVVVRVIRAVLVKHKLRT